MLLLVAIPTSITGLVLGMVIPTGVTSFIWVSIYKGNSALTLAIILIDSLLSPFIVPYSLSLFVGQKVEMDTPWYDEWFTIYDCSSFYCWNDFK